MQKLPDDILFDTRLIERHIRSGMITREEVDKRLQSIRDMAEQADEVAFEDLGGRRKHPAAAGSNGGEEPTG